MRGVFGLLLAALLAFGCEESRPRTPQSPTSRLPSCTVPECDSACDCDTTHSCDPGCGRCDPECGSCRPAGPCRDANPSDGGTTDGGLPPGAVGLTVLDAFQSNRAGLSSAAPGERFAIVSLRLANNSTVALPLVFSSFSMATTEGLTVAGDAVTLQVEDACPSTATLGTGHDITCTVVFRGPNQASMSLTYAAPNGPTVTVPLAVRACTECGRDCVDTTTDPNNCGGCGVVVMNGVCVDGRPGCSGGRQACGSECVNTNTDPRHCGGCNQAINSREMTCVGGLPRCGSSNQTPCGNECVYTDSDRDHCGACNQTCNADCDEGRCGEWRADPNPRPCSTVCSGSACIEAGAEYGGACAGGSIHRIFFRSCAQVPPATFTPPDQPGCTLDFVESRCFCGP